ncbi:unnamed protein product [Soboliphyme baturini]|uniref:GAR domain-containing protein n=1 Tax=Soboliphyme baturini TaxID=241478 RepID=A0A3P8ELB6_9BILA|nr:unnamed protein product [Soboliphyme baturini]
MPYLLFQPKSDAEKIKDEVQRQSQLCTCQSKYKIKEVGDGKYKFGEQLRLVRILRSTVMVRVGGGWVALDEFLVKNDPCRAKGRTNIELREKFILPEGVSQSMWRFKTKSGRLPDSHPSVGHTPGPIMKASHIMRIIRERTERSFPMSKPLLSNSAVHSSDLEVSNILSSARWQGLHHESDAASSPDSTRMAHVLSTEMKPSSRSSSRASSDIPRPSSRPPSRASSDVSDISIHSRDSLGSNIPSRIPSARKKPRGKP